MRGVQSPLYQSVDGPVSLPRARCRRGLKVPVREREIKVRLRWACTAAQRQSPIPLLSRHSGRTRTRDRGVNTTQGKCGSEGDPSWRARLVGLFVCDLGRRGGGRDEDDEAAAAAFLFV